MEEVLKELGIKSDGEYSKDGQYVVDIFDSDEFGKIYSVLERNDEVEELYDSSLLTVHNSNLTYLYGDYQLTLSADFDNNLYKLIVSEFEYVEDEYDDYVEDEEEDNE